MREIKFRAWFREKPDWHHSRMFYQSQEPAGIGDWFSEVEIYQADAIIMQYTGLKDKNGNEIYEFDNGTYLDFYLGDNLVKGGIAEVKYQDDGFGIYNDEDYICCLWDAVKNYGFEIIGNIYENPELL